MTVGTQLPTRRINEVSAEHIRQIALVLRDPNPIHFDLDAVHTAGLGDREVNQGGATMAYVMDLLTEWAGSRAALKRISCSFRANVFAGDEVLVGGAVSAIAEEDGARLVECEVWAESGGRRVITGTATVALG
ncbi:MaoC family dehydratase [Jongsikchunia kroppenstedtii]|uniref:MaoC family dehydratase n=1 Tax=Jongsikchunia kroppenstedtii TaxID=1121721 RepID=UPI000380E945|nr:MaoC/PaaZ C-terminal domain-containing protein [Jongsikchunia kroppenstedtii]